MVYEVSVDEELVVEIAPAVDEDEGDFVSMFANIPFQA